MPLSRATARRLCGAREAALGDPLGLTSFGVNLTRLPPGTASALRHWHSLEDEFVMVLEGEATLITDAVSSASTAFSSALLLTTRLPALL